MIFALGIAMSHGCVVQALHTLVVFTADGFSIGAPRSLNISRSQEFTVYSYILTKEIPNLKRAVLEGDCFLYESWMMDSFLAIKSGRESHLR